MVYTTVIIFSHTQKVMNVLTGGSSGIKSVSNVLTGCPSTLRSLPGLLNVLCYPETTALLQLPSNTEMEQDS